MSTTKQRATGKPKRAAIVRFRGRPVKAAAPKAPGKPGRRPTAASGGIARKRAEIDAALAEARKSHERLREAIDLLPQGVVFLDAEGRYILWNKKYAEMYSRSSDLFKPGARLEDTIRIGVARGDTRKQSTARKNGSRRGSRSCTGPASGMNRPWPTAASS